jgi:hypothetical protein
MTQSISQHLGLNSYGVQWSRITGDANASIRNGYMFDVSANATLTLPANPLEGDSVGFADYKDLATTYTLKIGANGKNIMGSSDDLTISVNGLSGVLTYSDAARGWIFTTIVYNSGKNVLASSISVDTTNFDNNLSSADDTLQKALETLDDSLTYNPTIDTVSDHTARLALAELDIGFRCTQDDLAGVVWEYVGPLESEDSSWNGYRITNEDGELVGKIIVRTGTNSELTGQLLDAGEPGYATDTGKFAVGDGTTLWENLIDFAGWVDRTSIVSASMVIAPFAHISTNSKHYRSIQFISTKNGAVDGFYVKTTTGYARITNFDTTQEANAGAGTPASFIYLEGGVPGTGYDNVLPKFYVIDPTDVSGSLSGDITYLWVKTGLDITSSPPAVRSSNITALNVAGLPELTSLLCYGNYLTLLDVAGCTSLSTLRCHSNSLTSLDVAGLTSLSTLECYSNRLTSLDVSGCTSLASLHCGGNSLTSLDLTGLTSLSTLRCDNNSLTSLDVSGLTSLSSLNCGGNSLTSLDLTGLTSLSTLACGGDSSLTSLDVSGCTSLASLSCYNNSNLTQLVIPDLHTLYYIDTHESGITSLDLSNSSGQPLIFLELYDGALETLDISNACNPSATLLRCQNNNLTSIRAVGLRAVYMPWWYYAAADLSNNQLSAEALDQFYTDLAVDATGTGIIDVSGNPGVTGHDPSIATAKGYTVLT